MSLLVLTIVLTVAGLVWYAYNGGVHTGASVGPTPTLNSVLRR